MTLYKNKYHSESNRLQSWDYRTPGWYFVTLCTQNRKHYFGEIRNGRMGLSTIGCAVWEMWEAIPEHFNYIRLGEFIVMPDHVHAIIEITPKYIDENNINLSTYNHGYYYQRNRGEKAYPGSKQKEKEAQKKDLAQTRPGLEQKRKKSQKQDRAQACHGADQKKNDSSDNNSARSRHGSDEERKKAHKKDLARSCHGSQEEKNDSSDNNSARSCHGTTRQHSESSPNSHGTPRQSSHPIAKLQPKSGSLGLIVNQFKAAVTRWCRKNDYPYFPWQTNYHDHIIRNGFQLDRIAEYIRNNPSAWGEAGI